MKFNKSKDKKKNKSHIPQRKSLSQVFLKESWPCEEIAEKLVSMDVKKVLEIGPGSGALTKELLNRGLKVVAVEKDERFAEYINGSFRLGFKDEAKGLSVIQKDILELNLEEFLDQNPDVTAICGNIPYAISTQIVSQTLFQLKRLKIMTFLVQLEFAERLVSPTSKKSYGSLSVYTQLRSQVHLDFVVEKKCFTPIPKVDSAVINFLPKEKMESEQLLSKVEKISKTVFSQRRKKLSNSLKPFLSSIEPTALTLDLDRRCDTLSPEEFCQLARELYRDIPSQRTSKKNVT